MPARLEREYPDTNRNVSAFVAPMRDHFVSETRSTLWILLAAVGFVLLIGCANIANLLLARASGRRREIAIRTAVGAGRGELVRQLLTESLLLSIAGGMVGLLAALWGIHFLEKLVPGGIAAITATAGGCSRAWLHAGSFAAHRPDLRPCARFTGAAPRPESGAEAGWRRPQCYRRARRGTCAGDRRSGAGVRAGDRRRIADPDLRPRARNRPRLSHEESAGGANLRVAAPLSNRRSADWALQQECCNQ